jgi:acyl carrier protein
MQALLKIKLIAKDKIMSIKQTLFKIIGSQLGVGTDEISLKSNFMDDLGADSLDTIEIVLSIEEEFNIEIPDHEVEQMETVVSVLNYLTANVKN